VSAHFLDGVRTVVGGVNLTGSLVPVERRQYFSPDSAPFECEMEAS